MLRKSALKGLAVLVLMVAVAAPTLAADAKKTILIVDMGNIMRSVIAETLIARKLADDGLADRYEVISRGIQGTPASPVAPGHGNLSFYNVANGSNAWESSLPALEQLGIADAVKEHKATVVSARDFEKAAIVIVTDEKEINNPEWGLNTQFPGFREKMIVIGELVGSSEGVADAYQAGTAGNKYETTVYRVANIIDQGYRNLLKRLQ